MSTETDTDAEDGGDLADELEEAHLIALLDDTYAGEETVEYSDRVDLTRCETDRPLYTIRLDGAVVTTIDISDVVSSNQLGKFLDDHDRLQRLAEGDEEPDEPGDRMAWH